MISTVSTSPKMPAAATGYREPLLSGELFLPSVETKVPAMIVYGDPQHAEEVGLWVSHMRTRVATLATGSASLLGDLRKELIMAGQLEQGVHDALKEDLSYEEIQRCITPFGALTALAAEAFYSVWSAQIEGAPTGVSLEGALAAMLQTLHSISSPGRGINIKMPEGFAFYALYPEQYCAAALRWLADHPDVVGQCAVVIGIRSIGTSLAAVVAAALAAGGCAARSFTVRPTGHPFERQVKIVPAAIEGAEWALVVDEGPGISGSSMAAAGAALVGTGLLRSKISFLPAHRHEPGSAATDEVRGWWQSTPRYVTSFNDLSFDGMSFPRALAHALPSLTGVDDPVVAVEDISGGQWRRVLYRDSRRWPPSFAPFERPKYLCTLRSGAKALFKFEGLAGAPGGSETTAEKALAQLGERFRLGWGPAPLGVAYGFVAQRWVEGAPLKRKDADPQLPATIGRYIAQVAEPFLTEREIEVGVARLREILYWNSWEALGESAAEATRSVADRVLITGASPGYGDGHMAPYEWLRTPSGQVMKLDSSGHSWDHTAVGVQPVAWDVAAALVEWGLYGEAATPLLQAFTTASGCPIPPATLNFYRVAYLAFRMGLCSICANMSAHDPAEQARLRRAHSAYKSQLAAALVAARNRG